MKTTIGNQVKAALKAEGFRWVNARVRMNGPVLYVYLPKAVRESPENLNAVRMVIERVTGRMDPCAPPPGLSFTEALKNPGGTYTTSELFEKAEG